MNNFWYFLMSGLLYFINLVIVPLFGGAGAYHKAMGLANLIGYNAYVVLEVAFDAMGSFDMRLGFACVGITLVLWIIKFFINIYLTIKGYIPGLGGR